MNTIVAVKKETAPKQDASAKVRPADRTPVSASGVVRRASPHHPPRDTEPPGLTPYRARLDVEMDDTAVSKVRDPSVSISLHGGDLLQLPAARKSPALPSFAPVYSVALGAVFGALVVALIVLLVRAATR